MIIKSKARAGGRHLGRYLTDGKNQDYQILEADGLATMSLPRVLRLMERTAAGSACEKPLYHVQFRTPEGEDLTDRQWLYCADRLETKLGLQGHDRVIVLHESAGHRHMHVVWNRMDPETGTAAQLSYDHRQCMAVARTLEKELGLQQVSSAKHPARAAMRPPKESEIQQARRCNADVHQARADIAACYAQAANGQAFQAALDERGYILAQGNRRALLVFDAQGVPYALSKRITGVPVGAMRAKLADLDRADLPTFGETQAHFAFLRENQDKAAPASPSAGMAERTAQQAYYDLQDERAAAWDTQLHEAALLKAAAEDLAARQETRLDKAPDPPKTMAVNTASLDAAGTFGRGVAKAGGAAAELVAGGVEGVFDALVGTPARRPARADLGDPDDPSAPGHQVQRATDDNAYAHLDRVD